MNHFRAQPGKDLWLVGGGGTIASFLDKLAALDTLRVDPPRVVQRIGDPNQVTMWKRQAFTDRRHAGSDDAFDRTVLP